MLVAWRLLLCWRNVCLLAWIQIFRVTLTGYRVASSTTAILEKHPLLIRPLAAVVVVSFV